MNWRQALKDYFIFSRKERIGILVLIILIVGVWLSPQFISSRKSPTTPADTSWITTALKLEHRQKQLQDDSEQEISPDELMYDKSMPGDKTYQLFYFDPNTLSASGWNKLGIREKTIRTLQNYLSKGGHFYKAEDLKKIYGVNADDYARLEPYIKIETSTPNSNRAIITENNKKQTFNEPKYNAVDINNADSSAFVALPGIGNKLASRIINFRDNLGGFYSIEQISEIYGLPDSSFQKIKPYLKLGTTSLKKININTATKEEMRSHPYIRWNLANAIVEYRNQHGNFSSVDDLKKIALITDEVFNKIRFYLTL